MIPIHVDDAPSRRRAFGRRRWMAGSAVVTVALTAIAWTSATAQASEARDYVALGDSYAAGVGAGNYRDLTCRQSIDGSYPARWVAARTRQPGDSVVDRSCNGATIASVAGSQLSDLGSDTGWVTITIGGNDVGFVPTLQQCVLGDDAACHRAVQASMARMTTTLPTALDGLFGQIRSKAPQARVVVVGYPLLVAPAGEGHGCGTLTDGKRATLNAAAATLADVTRNSTVSRAGFSYLDGRTVFAGHEACSASPWIHGIRGDLTESFHPTPAGHQAYADALKAVTGP
ncbi:SGNH/GDSL hydrolase family protein [Actinoplanes sp. NPDC049548]|uniref:SGNH/GDSL hydrolase family protein n=1 Tax=Actinoplanes sp. NPDC049548 TaxID=3155152 RepID=UPI003439371B